MKQIIRHCEEAKLTKQSIPNWIASLTLAMTLVILLTACGFHPTYGVNKYTATGVEEVLAQVEIGNIPDREGQYLRNALIDRFYRTGRPAVPTFDLSIEPVRQTLQNLDITKSSDATRGQLKLRTKIQLRDRRNKDKVILERDLHAITSYNILSSEFSTRVSEENARQNALDDLARQIELQIALYFKR